MEVLLDCPPSCQAIYLHTSLTSLLEEKILSFTGLVAFELHWVKYFNLIILSCGSIIVPLVIHWPVSLNLVLGDFFQSSGQAGQYPSWPEYLAQDQRVGLQPGRY